MKVYSYAAPQTFLDAVNVQFRLQSPGGGASSYAAEVQADSRQQALTARYSSGRNAFQVQARRQSDPVQKSETRSGTFAYSYSPTVPATGVALTNLSTYYSYSGSRSATQSTQVHSGGLNAGVRFSDQLFGSLNGAATLVDIQAGTYSSVQRSATLSGSLNYRKDATSASASPSLTVAEGKTRWTVGVNARTSLRDDLALSGTATLSSTSPPTASADLQYDASALLGEDTPRGKLSVGAAVTVPPAYTVSGRVRTTVNPNLSLGGSASFTPATRDVTYAADASGKLGPVYISASTSLSTRPNTDPAFSVNTSVSSQAAPAYGSLSVSYRRQGLNQSGNASGTFGYRTDKLDLSTTLALTATQSAGFTGAGQTPTPGPWQISGSADLTAAYAVQQNLDVSASLRYEPGSGTTTPTRLRYGVGLRYRF
ncbi:hypothetical protein [Deinococcus radiotolerans]|uniref:Uncharacterized protein n=1 Tax=Deinococcus radiotolerans TaxID=1309407 RepID=A0ABQ2FRL0_9DEIO|nr:hypothetical protein [Deinococcus radiotolerans]GGL19550.1 hypothetical protein GCM10010844_43120 [Deinococcus radiotolerans]